MEQWELDLPQPRTPSTLGAGLPVGGKSSGSKAGGCSDDGSDADSCASDGDDADSGGASGVCITWRAETRLRRGDEVCNFYNTLTNDRWVLNHVAHIVLT